MKSLKYLNKYLFKYKYRLLFGFVFIVLSNIFAVYPAQLIREALDLVEAKLKGIEITDTSFLTEYMDGIPLTKVVLIYGAIVFIAAIIKGAFTFFMRQTIIIMSRLVEYDLKNEVYNHYQDLDASFYKSNNTGDIMNRISEDVTKVRMYLGPGIMYSLNLIVLFIIVVPIMFSISVKLTMYSLIPLPILSIIIYYVSNVINQQSSKVQAKLSDITTLTQETYSGIRIIKSFVKEDYFNKELNKQNENYRSLSMNLVRTNAYFAPTMLLLIGLSTIFTIYIGGQEYIAGNITKGNILEFVIYINMLTWPVTAIGWVSSIIQRASASQERINEFLNTKSKIKNPTDKIEEVKGDIEFNNVSFTYPESGINALKNVSFKVKQGETLAIVGRTGSGKSTVVNLLLRNYDLNEGAILIDNKNIKEINLNHFRENVGYVPQDVFLFSDTIENNIAFGYKNRLPEKEIIEQAAKDAVIYASIKEFDKGFKTRVGERGVTLSGGQKQRISIARAIIKSPKILIFDDCLSAVDTETEDAILNNLKRVMENKTSIIVSHRVSTVRNADKIVVLEEGKMVEFGTHNELLNAKGAYYKMHEKQLMEEARKNDETNQD
ncbi:MAG: ABC transporter ATP-binding protein/permease [Flavobacteriales bacterium]|nr:ABC transporter ATP-binding protein/permease [Flavobacteriales bacterium]MCW8912701.1 ABC transporter ATP-binding protein/permease [Flavobacteriales bacterium]MCW8936811.1 ABC transporter ATP-binding protein/permease [Flavobacteriales bacterium]MCW8968132.1 ABC transporter ATP-binding protein/permease [Flavobacteriales bacterium]MCW8989358.1 ABC transporter ATP-binding protein/permease [Flavobacteriales bacterium]